MKLIDFIETEFVFQDSRENEIEGSETEVKMFACFNYYFMTSFFPHTVFSDIGHGSYNVSVRTIIQSDTNWNSFLPMIHIPGSTLLQS
jgi:hypothetical protein